MSLSNLLKQHIAKNLPNSFTEESLWSAYQNDEIDEETYLREKKNLSNGIITPALSEDQIKINREYWEKVNAPVVYQEFTAEELFTKLESNPMVVIDENNRRAIKILCLYFTNDIRFEDMGGSLQKGLMIRGGIGIGKTYLMELFNKNQKQSYSIKNCGEIASQFTVSGRDILDQYTTLKTTVASSKNFGQDKLGICFDDLGCEKEGVNYADRVEILAPILEMRYNRKLHAQTHITTNLPPDSYVDESGLKIIGLQEKYGDRLRSRMREMFNVIDFPLTATDRRK